MVKRAARTPNYAAVATAVAVQSVVFAVAALLRPHISPLPASPLAGMQADYLRRAARQPVRWRVVSDDPFREAQRLDRPVFVVAGSAKSATARAFDFRILGLPEVAERLNREFVPVRIDLDQMPEWASAVLPASAAAANVDEAWWSGCFDPAGNLLVWMARAGPQDKVDEPEVLGFLTEARRARAAEMAQLPRAEERQRLERTLFSTWEASGGHPDHADRLAGRIDPLQGGFRTEGTRRPWPWEWRYLVRLRDTRSLMAGLYPYTRGPLMDWSGPGCYRQSSDRAGRAPSFARDAVLDADCAALFADWAALTGEPWPRFLAAEFVRGVRETYVRPEGVYGFAVRDVPGSLVGPARLVPPKRLAKAVGRKERARIQETVRVGDRPNVASVPVAASPGTVLSDPEGFRAAVRKVTDVAGAKLTVGSRDYLDTTAWLAARMLETSRLAGLEDARDLGLELFARAKELRAGPDDVVRTKDIGGGRSRTLVEYVAYAEAALEAYLVTGDPSRLDDATAVFSRAMALFSRPGGRLATTTGPVRQPFALDLPSLFDGDRPGTVGSTVRVAWRLSCAWRGTAKAAPLRERALAVANAYRGLAAQTGIRTGAFELASLEARRDEFVVVAGPGCVAWALELGPKLQGILAIPATRAGGFPVPGPGAWRIAPGQAPARVVLP